MLQGDGAISRTHTDLTPTGFFPARASVDGWRQAVIDAQSATTDLANAQADAADLMRDAAAKLAQDAVDAASHTGRMSSSGLRNLELTQRLEGTYDSAGGAQGRADFIRTTIIPAILGELSALIAQQADAQAAGNSALAKQIAEAIADKTGDSLQAEIDARDILKSVDSQLKDFAGSIGWSYRDQPYTDRDVDVIAARLGA